MWLRMNHIQLFNLARFSLGHPVSLQFNVHQITSAFWYEKGTSPLICKVSLLENWILSLSHPGFSCSKSIAKKNLILQTSTKVQFFRKSHLCKHSWWPQNCYYKMLEGFDGLFHTKIYMMEFPRLLHSKRIFFIKNGKNGKK